MSSILAAFARGVPKAVGLVAGNGVGSRAARTHSVRMLSAGPLSGLSSAKHSSSSRSEGHQQTSLVRRAHACASNRTMQQQQARSMSSESNNNEETGVEATNDVDLEADSPTGEAEDAAPVAEESAAAATPVVAPVMLVQVDGIPFSLTQGELEQWFADAGCTPVSVTMPLRPDSSNRPGQNKGRAYVEMANEEDAEAAVALGGRSIGERWIHVARLEMLLEECRTISVRGLKGVPENDLIQLLEEEVGCAPLSVRIVDHPSRNQGLAFADFATHEEAQKALSLDGANIGDRWVDVSLQLVKRRTREARIGVNASNPPFPEGMDGVTVVLKGLPFALTEDEISAFLQQNELSQDEVLQLNVPKHNMTQKNTGVAYVLLKDYEACEKAMVLKGSYIGDRWIDVSKWNDRPSSDNRMSHKAHIENMKSTVPAALRKKYPDLPCVVVSGLPFHKTHTDVTEYLAEQGVPRESVEEIQMPLFLQTQNNTGACWLVINQEEAYNRMMELNGAIMDDRWVTIADA